MVAGDPIGPPQDARPRAGRVPVASAPSTAGGVAFLAVREADAPIYRERGMQRDLPRRRGDPALRPLHARGPCDEGGARGGQPRRARPRLRADLREIGGDAGAGGRAQRDQRRVARRRAGARLHDGAGRGRRGRASTTSCSRSRATRAASACRLPALRARLRRGPRLLARPDAPPLGLDQRPDRVPDRQRGAGARGARRSAAVAELRRLGPTARQRRERRAGSGAAAADRARAEPVLPDPVAARLQRRSSAPSGCRARS